MDAVNKKLTLHAFLKILTAGDVPVSKAMAVASKIYKEFYTPSALAQLDDAKLNVFGVDDKELRKSVLAAIRKAGYTAKAGASKTEHRLAAAGPSSLKRTTAVHEATTPRKKKRKLDDDLNDQLPLTPPDEASTYGNLDFEEILDEEVLRTKRTTVNRAPLMTAWAMTVAERLGFEREEALSIADSYAPQELNEKGYSIYADFRPDVDGWGKRGEVRCATILSLRKNKPEWADGTAAEDHALCSLGKHRGSALKSQGDSALPSKESNTLTLEEYEATWVGQAEPGLPSPLASVLHYHLVKSISGPPPSSLRNLSELRSGFARVLKCGLASHIEEIADEDDARPGSPAEAIVQLRADDPRAVEFREWMRAWFRRATWSSIKKQDVYSYLHWVFYNKAMPPMEMLSKRRRALLDEAIFFFEKRAGKTVSNDPSIGVQPIRLTIDEVNVNWRPFTWYVMVLTSNWVLKNWLVRSYGVQFGCYNGLDYLVRIPQSWDPDHGRRPIVFLHGLGLGLMQYKLILSDLLKNHLDRPLLVPLQPHVGQNIFHPRFLRPMSRHEMTACLVGLLREFGWAPSSKELDNAFLSDQEPDRKGVVILSHSYGSFVHAWFLKAYPHLAVRSCLVDPVAICCWEGDMCYNFIYKRCSTGMDLLMRYFVGSELGVANTLQRHFDWTSNSLWFEDLPNAHDPDKTLVMLGGKDVILNAERIRRYLASHGVRKGIYFDPEGRHGQPFVGHGHGYDTITKWLQLA
ncbi:hypothetical protein ID866_5364 [Astraeus odoratus]|nr:hypothetical protein ID866_5364 [Astraeus odoratus]